MVLLQWRNWWLVTKYLVQSFYSLVFLRLDSAGSRKGPQSPMAFVSLPDNGRRVLKPLKCNFPPWLRRGIEVYCPASVWWGRCRQFQNWGTPGTKTVIVCLADCVSIIVYERIYQTLPSFFHTQRRNSGVFNGFFFACRRWTSRPKVPIKGPHVGVARLQKPIYRVACNFDQTARVVFFDWTSPVRTYLAVFDQRDESEAKCFYPLCAWSNFRHHDEIGGT